VSSSAYRVTTASDASAGGTTALYRLKYNTGTSFGATFNSVPEGNGTTKPLAVGDSLSLRFSLRYTSTTNDRLRFGCFDSQKTSSVFSDDAGYYISTDTQSGTYNYTADVIRQTTGTPLLPSSSSLVGSATPATENQRSFGTTRRILTLTLTRLEEGMQLGYTRDEMPSLVVTDSSAPLTSFDTLYIGSSTGANPFFVDDVAVTYAAVPEPGTVALVAGVVGLALAQRQRAPLSRWS
jgi:hypothetical protein